MEKNYKRYCKILKLKNNPELIEEYKNIHKPKAVWPEIVQGMKEVGIIDMEIYLYENIIFMIMDIASDVDHENAMQELAKKPMQAEWEAFVSKFQEASENASAGEKWKIMERIFKL